MKRVAIIQSNYIPWKGYFDLLAYVDEFILLDSVQYTRRDWRNRNKIKTPNGSIWLSIPVKVKGKYTQTIENTAIADSRWKYHHLRTLELNYARSPYFNSTITNLRDWYNFETQYLSQMNEHLINQISDFLDLGTKIVNSRQMEFSSDKNQRLIDICKQVSADVYVTGMVSRNYLDENLFNKNSISVEWFDYEGYQEYPQLWGKFDHQVSILDAIFNCGNNAKKFLRFPKK